VLFVVGVGVGVAKKMISNEKWFCQWRKRKRQKQRQRRRNQRHWKN
jgi:hypothetical protein